MATTIKELLNQQLEINKRINQTQPVDQKPEPKRGRKPQKIRKA